MYTSITLLCDLLCDPPANLDPISGRPDNNDILMIIVVFLFYGDISFRALIILYSIDFIQQLSPYFNKFLSSSLVFVAFVDSVTIKHFIDTHLTLIILVFSNQTSRDETSTVTLSPECIHVFSHLYLTRTKTVGFYRATACNATHGIAVAILSVRPSVCPSVCPSVRQMRVL